MKMWLLILLATLVLTLGVVVAYGWYKFRTPLLGHVELSQTIDPARYDLAIERHEFTAADGLKLTGYSAVHANKTTSRSQEPGWILLVHGYTPNGWKSMLAPGKFLYEQGYNVFFLSLRSYGDSEGDQVYLGTREWQDVVAADAFIRKQLAKDKQEIGWYGVSMGAASSLVAAGQLPETDQPAFIIAQVPFATIQSLLFTQIKEENLPLPIFRPLAEVVPTLEFGPGYRQYTALENVSRITTPTLVIGAERDNQVQFSDSRLLYEKLGTPANQKSYAAVDTGHDAYSEQPTAVQEIMTVFLNSLQEIN